MASLSMSVIYPLSLLFCWLGSIWSTCFFRFTNSSLVCSSLVWTGVFSSFHLSSFSSWFHWSCPLSPSTGCLCEPSWSEIAVEDQTKELHSSGPRWASGQARETTSEQWLKNKEKFLRSFFNKSFPAVKFFGGNYVEKHWQYFSRGWQSMKVFLILWIPQDLVLPPFPPIWPLTLCLHPGKQISLFYILLQGVSFDLSRPKISMYEIV